MSHTGGRRPVSGWRPRPPVAPDSRAFLHVDDGGDGLGRSRAPTPLDGHNDPRPEQRVSRPFGGWRCDPARLHRSPHLGRGRHPSPTSPIVAVRDSGGSLVSGDNTTPVTSPWPGPGGAVLTCTGGNTRTASMDMARSGCCVSTLARATSSARPPPASTQGDSAHSQRRPMPGRQTRIPRAASRNVSGRQPAHHPAVIRRAGCRRGDRPLRARPRSPSPSRAAPARSPAPVRYTAP